MDPYTSQKKLVRDQKAYQKLRDSKVPLTMRKLRRMALLKARIEAADDRTSGSESQRQQKSAQLTEPRKTVTYDNLPSGCCARIVEEYPGSLAITVTYVATPIHRYTFCLRFKRLCFPLRRDNIYALADCDEDGYPKRLGFQLVRSKKFKSPSGEVHVLYLCPCDASKEQNSRLSVADGVVTDEKLKDFATREESLYCLHAQARQRMTEPERQEDGERGGPVEHLKTEPFLAAVYDGKAYGMLRRIGKSKLCCMSCKKHKQSCIHVKMYTEHVNC
uniref:Uncharacterized protein n=1 Tax=Branchiostoma floridae TaxID=7739 RepID=C3ZS88_BRAFL|eukprot:XP_002588609.1 hypothetical protein BRAFLDRAFT_131754 [Branchiostoma floridae]